jgi:hypothetical protein
VIANAFAKEIRFYWAYYENKIDNIPIPVTDVK